MANRNCLIVAPVGDPTAYRQVEYELQVPEPQILQRVGRHSLSSVAVAKGLYEAGYCSDIKLLIVAADSLLANSIIVDPQALEGTASYEQLLRLVEGSVSEYLEGKRGEKLRDMLAGLPSSCEWEVKVAATLGRYRDRYGRIVAALNVAEELRSSVSISDLYGTHLLSYSLHSLLEVLNTKPASELSVIIDTSHGVNYMPNVAARIGRSLALAAAIASGSPVEYLEYCSDPVIGAAQPTHAYRINLIDRRVLGPKAAAAEAYAHLLLTLGGETRGKDDEVRVVKSSGARLSGIVGSRFKIGYAAAIHHFCLLLAAVQYARKPEARVEDAETGGLISTLKRRLSLAFISDYLGSLLKALHKHYVEVQVGSSGGAVQVNVEWRAAPLYGSAEALLFEAAFGDAIARVLKILECRRYRAETPTGFVDMEVLRDKILPSLMCLSEAEIIAQRELSGEVDACLERKEGVTCFLDLDEGGRVECGESQSLDLRHVIAHAGLNREAVEVRIIRGRLVVRYGVNCFEKVVNAARKELRKLT